MPLRHIGETAGSVFYICPIRKMKRLRNKEDYGNISFLIKKRIIKNAKKFSSFFQSVNNTHGKLFAKVFFKNAC